MLIDMHVHTAVSSPCSQIDPRQLVEAAQRIGLDALCVTEHEELEGAETARRMGAEAGFLVLRGVEVYTEMGDMLVFGLYRRSYPVTTPFDELLAEVREAGGVIIPAHPCRGSRGFHELLDEERAEFLLANIDAIETRNGGTSPEANAAAQAYADRYGISGVGGSDAHFLMQLGRCLTVFERQIESEAELVEEIRAGRCRAAYAAEVEKIKMSEIWR